MNNDWKTVPAAYGCNVAASAAAPRFGRAAVPAPAPSPASSTSIYRPAFGREAAPAGTPNAFSRAPPTERQMARQSDSARMAEEQRRQREVDIVAARKEAESLNFASHAAYPALGGGAAGAAKPKTALNYKRTVEEMVVREKEREAVEAVAAAANWWDDAEPQKPVAPKRYIRQRVMDELDDDHLSVEEEDTESEGTEEFNADIVPGRRRGDKGVW